MSIKLGKLLACIGTGNELPPLTAENRCCEPEDPAYLVDVSTVQKWDSSTFCKWILRITCDWSLSDIHDFQTAATASLLIENQQLEDLFNESAYVPKFVGMKNINQLGQWNDELLEMLDPFFATCTNHEMVIKACIDFANGKGDIRFIRDDLVQYDIFRFENHAVISLAEKAFLSFTKGMMGEFGKEIFSEMVSCLRKAVIEKYPGAAELDSSSDKAKAQSIHTFKQIFSSLALKGFIVLPAEASLEEERVVKFQQLAASTLEKFAVGTAESEALLEVQAIVSNVSSLTVGLFVTKLEASIKSSWATIKLVALKMMEICHATISADAQQATTAVDPKVTMVNGHIQELIESLARHKKAPPKPASVMISNLGEILFPIFEKSMKLLHPSCFAACRLTRSEQGVLALEAGQEKLGPETEMEDKLESKSYLRTISASPNVSSLLGGVIHEGQGISYQALITHDAVKIADAKDSILVDDQMPILCSSSILTEPHFNILSIPSSQKDYEGTFDVILIGDDQLTEYDLTMLKAFFNYSRDYICAKEVAIRQVDTIRSAKHYIESASETTLKQYYINPSDSEGSALDVYEIIDLPNQMINLGSSYLQKADFNLHKVQDSDKW